MMNSIPLEQTSWAVENNVNYTYKMAMEIFDTRDENNEIPIAYWINLLISSLVSL